MYGLLVYKWCCQTGLPRQDAADVGQEVLSAVYRNLEQVIHEGIQRLAVEVTQVDPPGSD